MNTSTILIASMPVPATPAPTVEHEAWKEDTERWRKQHDEAMVTLKDDLPCFTEEQVLD